MTLKEIRDMLCGEKVDEKRDPQYNKGYVNGVLDFYNKMEKERKQ